MSRMVKSLILYTLISTWLSPFSFVIAQEKENEQTSSNGGYRSRNKRKKYKFDFDSKPLVDIINELADLKKINILLPQGALAITARVTYHLPDPVSINEAWKILTTLLSMTNYTIKPDGDMWMIIKTDTPNITREVFNIYIDEPLEKLPNSEEIIQALFYLTNLNVKSMQSDLQAMMLDMLTPNIQNNNNIKWDAKTNSVILTDKSIFIKNVMKIIQELDQSGLRDSIEVVPLYYTSAQVIDSLFNQQLFAPPAGAMNGASQAPQASYFPRNTKVMALERTNSLVIMGTQHAISLVKDFIIKYLDRPLESGESILHVYELKYLPAKDVAPVLQQILTPGGQTQAGGKIVGPKQYFKDVIVIAEVTNSTEALTPTPNQTDGAATQPTETQGTQLGGNRLIIAARKQDWIRIKKLIDDLDKPQPQIALEVLILDLTLDANKAFGTQLRNPAGFNDVFSKNVNFQSAQLNSPILTPPTGDSFSVSGQPINQFPADALRSNLLQCFNIDEFPCTNNLATQAIPGSLVVALKDTAFNNVWAVFFLLDSFANTTILAQPFLITQNHQQATAIIQQTRLLQMGADTSQGGVVPVEFKATSAGMTLDILPHISSLNNTINLQVTVNLNAFTNDPQNPDNKITRVVQTSATVGNGEILALGGLIREDDVINTTKVPILGDIPIVGWLFKQETKQRVKNNLLILIAPTIIKPRLKGGIDPYTCKKLEYAENELDEHLVFENLRDPITRWFFKPDITRAQRTIDAYTHHSLHIATDTAEQEALAEAPSFYAKNEELKPVFDTQVGASKLKELVKNEDNPLSGLEKKQL